MTVVEEKIYIIGGSFGQMYYQDFYSFDTSNINSNSFPMSFPKIQLQKSR